MRGVSHDILLPYAIPSNCNSISLQSIIVRAMGTHDGRVLVITGSDNCGGAPLYIVLDPFVDLADMILIRGLEAEQRVLDLRWLL